MDSFVSGHFRSFSTDKFHLDIHVSKMDTHIVTLIYLSANKKSLNYYYQNGISIERDREIPFQMFIGYLSSHTL